MKKSGLFPVLAVACAAWLGGCASPQSAAEAPAAATTVSADDYRRTFEAAVESLRAHGFLIDRQDYRFGRITAKPRISPKMFELWNRDNTTSSQSIASSINDIRRLVTVELQPQGGGEGPAASYDLTVVVLLERKTNPDRKLTGTADGYDIVRHLTETPAQYQRAGIEGEAYIDMERDPHFEARLLADIQQRAAAAPATSETVSQ